MLHLLPIKFFVFVTFLPMVTVTGFCTARATDTKTVTIMKKAREDAKSMTLPVNKHTKAGQMAAEQAADTFHSPKFQERIQAEQQRLEKEVFGDYIASWKKKKQPAKEQPGAFGNLDANERIYLFLSSSVPDETVHAYIGTIAGTGDSNIIPVMNGFVGGLDDIEISTKYFSRILKKNLECQDGEEACQRYQVSIKLKPSLFAQYGITQVPTVVYASDKDTFIITGDAGLDYLLGRINREVKSATLGGLIRSMRGDGH